MFLSSIFCSIPFIHKSTITSSRNTPFSHISLPSTSYIHQNQCRREFPIPEVASIPYQPINFDYLEQEFDGHGVTFEEVGENNCMAKMELKNGSTATMLLPSGLITSYKAPMWHGGKVELLHTSVSEGEFGSAVIQGGVSLNFNFQIDGDEVFWSSNNWVLHNVKGNSEESIQIELINKAAEDIGLKYIVTLERDGLGSEFEITNSKSLPLQMTGSILSHLTVSTPEATYAIGLEGSNYCSRPPFESEFILSPQESSKDEESFGKTWKSSLKQLFPRRDSKAKNNEEEEEEGSQRGSEDMDGEEMDSYKQLKEKISLVYTNGPRNFTLIDRGRRNSVIVGRSGFDETYLFSPGSTVESYSKYAYICVGQAAVLQPLVINPKDVWRGEQYLHNPNLG